MYLVNPMFERQPIRAFAGLGQAASQNVQVETSDVLSLGDDLRAAQARLSSLTQQMIQSPDLARAIARDVTAQQAKLSELITKYVGVYTAVFGQPPVGLGNPVLVGAAVVVILTYVAAQLYLWHQKQTVLEQQAQAAVLAEQNRGSLISMAQQKQASADAKAAAGDATGAADDAAAANALLLQAGTPGAPSPPPSPVADWLKANWIVAAGALVAVFVVPRLADR